MIEPLIEVEISLLREVVVTIETVALQKREDLVVRRCGEDDSAQRHEAGRYERDKNASMMEEEGHA